MIKTAEHTQTLVQKDKKHLWHPFTQMKDWCEEDPLIIESAEGVYLQDTNGRRYIDGVSSLWCNVHGHRVPELDAAITGQLAKVAHTTFLGLSNPAAIELAEKLIQISPPGMERVFYSDSGSEAVEIALKMAFQYWKQSGRPEKNKFVKLSQAYHGDTLGAVSVGGIELFHDLYASLLFETIEAPAPFVYRWPLSCDDPERVCREALEALENIFKQHHTQIAAFVMEPLMQGAAGMIRHPEGYLSGVRKLTKKYGILLILDEVATGFGRTGKMFASQHESVSPDLMTIAKGLTGGYLPLAATLASAEIYEAFLGEYEDCKTFFHGHTYTANPLACSVALANLALFEKRGFWEHIQKRSAQLARGLEAFKELEHAGDIRYRGMMAGIELVCDKKEKGAYAMRDKIGIRVIERARQKGAVLRPLGSVIVLMPPLAIGEAELDELLKITYQSIQEVTQTSE
ncbi:MAG: adenosylmethionine--8-amino-7-oxononanoate transaminase [Candidatus Omnitrophica bacterium]|nr:adenosylmethionine--8-amino-7-oxononanoate transaminase [Candidatus Omnitrophota bacterium]